MGTNLMMMALLQQQANNSKPVSTLKGKAYAWFDMDEGSGNIIVDKVNAWNGVIGSQVVVSAEKHTFNGDYWTDTAWDQMPDSDSIVTWLNNPHAIAVRFRLPNLNQEVDLLGQTYSLRVTITTAGVLRIRYYYGSASLYSEVRTSTNIISANTDYLAIFNTPDPTNRYSGREIWLNNRKQNIGTSNYPQTILNEADPFRIGAGWRSRTLIGDIYQVALFNDYLTADELTEFYNNDTKLKFEKL